jgi:hypothetical protein
MSVESSATDDVSECFGEEEEDERYVKAPQMAASTSPMERATSDGAFMLLANTKTDSEVRV